MQYEYLRLLKNGFYTTVIYFIFSNIMCKEDCKLTNNNRYLIIGICIGIFVVLIYVFSCVLIHCHFKDWGISGTFGDTFGAVNALFSGLAFVGLIITLIMQKDELGLQRDELKANREEMSRQRTEFEEQNKTMRLQRFENTLFNMLSLHETITCNLHYANPDIAYYIECSGREVFKKLYMDKIFDSNEGVSGVVGYLKKYGIHYYQYIDDIEVFDHYFRHLYRIYKFIDESKLINDNDRYEYSCIVRAKLSEYELLMLFYNCIQMENSKFKNLVEKYCILNNIRKDKLCDQNNMRAYNDSAFIRQ